MTTIKSVYNTFGNKISDVEETRRVGSKLSRASTEETSFWSRVKSLTYSTAIVTVATLTIFLGSILLISTPSKLNSDLVTLKNSFRPQEKVVAKSVLLDSNAAQYFLLKRVNYDSLPYFDRSSESTFNYAFLDKYISIIEPHADMEIKLYDAYRSSKNTYEFSICPASSDSKTECQYGSRSYNATTAKPSSTSFNFACNTYDEFDVIVTEISYDTGAILSTFEGSALCLYVRREVRALSDDHLSSLRDSMFALWSTSDDVGREVYGDDFHNITYLLRFHHFNAADRKTDHIHNGNGIILQHIKFTNIFEESLQLVDPSLALPYWDFTIDSADNKKANETFVMNSKLFGGMHKPTVFGNGFTYADDKIEDGAIVDGLWKEYRSDYNTFKDMDYAYGYLRAPWNLNPSPYVSRFTFNMTSYNMPNCADHYSLLQYENMMTFFDLGEFAPHGNVHILTGGAYGCDKFIPLYKEGYIIDQDTAKHICIIWSPVFLKTAYRYHYITPKADCVVHNEHLKESECGFTCNPDTKEDLIRYLGSLIRTDQLKLNLTKDGAVDAWTSFICDGEGGKVFSGDNFESASPIDPVFWLIHPPLERLLHAKMMGGGFDDEVWHTNPMEQTVCDFAQCYSDETGQLGFYEDCCYGHYEHDRLLDAVSGSRTSYFGPSNAETLAATDPRSLNYSMPYIYDQFVWDHCNEDFEGYIAGTTKTKRERKQGK